MTPEQEQALQGVARARDGLQGMRRGPERDAFYAAIVAARATGATYRSIAEQAGVSQERVSQIVQEHGRQPAEQSA